MVPKELYNLPNFRARQQAFPLRDLSVEHEANTAKCGEEDLEGIIFRELLPVHDAFEKGCAQDSQTERKGSLHYCELMGRIREPVVFRDRQILECAEELVELADTKQNLHKKKLLLARIFIRAAECMDRLSQGEKNNCPVFRGGSADRQYYLIEQYINTRYAQKTSADEIAELLNVSRRQADRIVKRIFGKTYTALIQERRMSLAQKMLQKTDIACTQIAEKTGYGTYAGFYVAFREYFGCAPEEMRQRSRSYY